MAKKDKNINRATQTLQFLEARCMNNYLAGFLAHLRLTPSHSKTNSGNKNVNQQQRGLQLQEQHPIFTGFPFKHFPKTSESNTKSGNKDIKENQTIKKFIQSIIIKALV